MLSIFAMLTFLYIRLVYAYVNIVNIVKKLWLLLFCAVLIYVIRPQGMENTLVKCGHCCSRCWTLVRYVCLMWSNELKFMIVHSAVTQYTTDMTPECVHIIWKMREEEKSRSFEYLVLLSQTNRIQPNWKKDTDIYINEYNLCIWLTELDGIYSCKRIVAFPLHSPCCHSPLNLHNFSMVAFLLGELFESVIMCYAFF